MAVGLKAVLYPDMRFQGQKVWEYIDGALKTYVIFEFKLNLLFL